MKITRVKIIEASHRPLMSGLELSFSEPLGDYLNANCFIGVNGSGKSQFLETIAEIFLYLDNVYRTIDKVQTSPIQLLFEIDYTITIKKKTYFISIANHKGKNKLPIVSVIDSNKKELDLKFKEVEKYLPTKIIGYTSGENETISIPFHSYYDVYAKYNANRARELKSAGKKDYEPRFYFMDYSTNLGIVISNLVFEEFDGIEYLKKELQLKKLKSFQIIIQTNQPNAPKIKSHSGDVGVLLTEDLKKWRQNLIDCATCYDYDEKHNKYTLDYLFTSATKEALTHFFNSAYQLYTVLYKFELLNNLIIDATTLKNIKRERKNRKLITPTPSVANKDKVLNYSELKLLLENDQTIDYLSLSDGEHQFFNVFGTILMVNHDNSLFLLDEPETHFNPKWRRLFVSHLKRLTENRNQDMFLTSHSPFIVSDSPKNSVYIFERVSKDQVRVRYPDQETFGASFNHILQMAFDLDEVISEGASIKIKELKEENDPKKIEEGLKTLGESSELMPLYRRIEMLEKGSK